MMKWQRRSMMGVRRGWLVPAIVVAALAGLVLLYLLVRTVGGWFGGPPPPETIAEASLQSMREQQRLTTLSARYVAVVTSSQNRGLLRPEKTMIMQGDVRYEVDLTALKQENLRWDEATRTLRVTLPPIEVSDPQVDLRSIQQYDNGSLGFRFTNAGEALDNANREAALKSLKEQAQAPMPMRTARESAKRAIARSFAMPLRAAGVQANVEVRFSDEQQNEPSYMDASPPISDVLGRPVNLNAAK